MAHIKFSNVTLQYPIYDAKAMSLRNQLVSLGTGGKMAHRSHNVVMVTALDNISLELFSGDSVGLIGHNGSGKTTLLRTIAGILTPSSGKIDVQGRISTIIELGAGMDPELSGYENIIRMGLLLGRTEKEAKASIPDIEDFTELGDFLLAPVRTYSAGMMMRLMFAVATSTCPEILLIDEMFGTGDIQFQNKALSRIEALIKRAEIFIFASHADDLIAKYCKRVFILEHGTLKEQYK